MSNAKRLWVSQPVRLFINLITHITATIGRAISKPQNKKPHF